MSLIKKRILIVLSVVAALLCIAGFIYLLMLRDVEPVVQRGREILAGTYSGESIEKPLKRYNVDWKDPATVESELNPIFTWHNFSDGIVVIQYKCFGENKYGGETGTGLITSTWHIHKENGQWIVVQVDEGP